MQVPKQKHCPSHFTLRLLGGGGGVKGFRGVLLQVPKQKHCPSHFTLRLLKGGGGGEGESEVFYCKCLNRNTVRVILTLRLLELRGVLLQVPKQKHCSSHFYSEAVGGGGRGGESEVFYCKCLNRNTVRVIFTLRLLGDPGALLQVPKQKHCPSSFYSEAVGGQRCFTASA